MGNGQIEASDAGDQPYLYTTLFDATGPQSIVDVTPLIQALVGNSDSYAGFVMEQTVSGQTAVARRIRILP